MVDLFPDESAARARKKEFFEPSGARHKEWCKSIVPFPMSAPDERILFQTFQCNTEELLLDYASKELKGHLDFMKKESDDN